MLYNWLIAETGGEPERRVPNYSSLTARESLENLRRRQLLKQQQAPPLSQPMTDIGAAAFVEADGTYDTINYDLIKACLFLNRFPLCETLFWY